MNIAENIREKRTKLGLTQEQLADMLTVKRPMITQIERGTKIITLPLAKEMARVFNCTIDDLVK